jgi:[ribosomal protein S5]-alanine N-acetyltransferase
MDVQLLELSPAAIHALATADLDAANRCTPVILTPYLISAECLGVWQMRSGQLDADPGEAAWITRVIVDLARNVAVGRAGYHGRPDSVGMVEVGYSVDQVYRRQGYARAALAVLLERAAREPSVRTVRATISPDNTASRTLVLQYGFVEVGEQWDAEDGLETIFEVGAELNSPQWVRAPSATSPPRSASPTPPPARA